jgi:hypothetical protein
MLHSHKHQLKKLRESGRRAPAKVSHAMAATHDSRLLAAVSLARAA